jgi:hypothetical protein
VLFVVKNHHLCDFPAGRLYDDFVVARNGNFVQTAVDVAIFVDHVEFWVKNPLCDVAHSAATIADCDEQRCYPPHLRQSQKLHSKTERHDHLIHSVNHETDLMDQLAGFARSWNTVRNYCYSEPQIVRVLADHAETQLQFHHSYPIKSCSHLHSQQPPHCSRWVS